MAEQCVNLAAVFAGAGLPEPVPEHPFAPPRRWRLDWAWPDYLVALEVEGGVFTGGRHVRGAGYRRDLEKYNAAALAGWCVLRVLPEQVPNSVALVETALKARGWKSE